MKALRNIGFRVLERAYSAERSTMLTWSTVFEFKRCVRACGGGSDLTLRETFAYDNSTFRSFRDSNYKIQFLYKNNYFPVNQKKVDFFHPPPGFDACDELGAPYFYGLCSPKMVEGINESLFGYKKISWRPQIALLRERSKYATKSNRPWFTWTHIKFPGHTPSIYRYPDPKVTESFKAATREDASDGREHEGHRWLHRRAGSEGGRDRNGGSRDASISRR